MATEHWYEPGRGANTPWGKADLRVTYAAGVDFYSTPSHGGFRLSAEREAELDAKLREWNLTAEQARFGYEPGWYEEDVSAYAVLFAFPEARESTNLSAYEALKGLLRWAKGESPRS